MLFSYRHECHCHADSLGKRRAECSARRAEVHCTHEQVVKRNVYDAGNCDKVHWRFAVAHAAKYGAYDVISRYKRNAYKANGEIRRRAAHGLRRRRHDGDDGIYEQKQHDSERDGHRHEKCHGVADKVRCLALIPCSDGLTDADGRTHGKADYHDGQHMHDLRADRDCGRARNALILTDYEQVSHAVERLQKIRQHCHLRKKYYK